jgi:hypothetical protein
MTPPQVLEGLAGLVGETTLTDDFLGMVHFPFKGTLNQDRFDLRLARSSRLPLPFPRVLGTIEHTPQGTKVRVLIAPHNSSNVFIVIWMGVCLGVMSLILTSWITHWGELHVHPLEALVFPVGLLAFGVVGYREAFQIGAAEATSFLASVLGRAELCSA